jgi:Mg-chelatase subunit ChlD
MLKNKYLAAITSVYLSSSCIASAWADEIPTAPPLQTGTQSTMLQTGTESTLLQTGTESTMLQTGTESTMLQTGTAGTMLQVGTEKTGGPVTILVIFDASLSMNEKIDHKDQKIDSAKKVLETALMRIPSDVKVGLRVFGHINFPSPCSASALLVPPGFGNRGAIIKRIRRIIPTGMTPLTFALQQAAENDLREVEGKKTIILITDGFDTCGEDPCAYIATLPYKGINIKVDVVGLDLRDKNSKRKLDCIAKLSNGKYYDAHTTPELMDSISHSVSQAISGVVMTNKGQNKLTPPELIPIVPMQKLVVPEKFLPK